MSRLHLEWKRREGGDGRTKRDYLDIIVDDQPLSEIIGGDMVSCLGWFVPEENAKAVRRLLLEETADLPDDRCSLYVCPECGDLGCGAVSLVVQPYRDRVIWRDFGYENKYEGIVRTEGYERLGPFIFDRSEYVRAIKKAL
jgi:hypothetical protein